MKGIFSPDWWRWEMYRHVALFVHAPTDVNQSKLTALISEFRKQSEQQRAAPHDCVPRAGDEHEYVMDYR